MFDILEQRDNEIIAEATEYKQASSTAVVKQVICPKCKQQMKSTGDHGGSCTQCSITLFQNEDYWCCEECQYELCKECCNTLDGWECSKCTLRNPRNTDRCSSCAEIRPCPFRKKQRVEVTRTFTSGRGMHGDPNWFTEGMQGRITHIKGDKISLHWDHKTHKDWIDRSDWDKLKVLDGGVISPQKSPTKPRRRPELTLFNVNDQVQVTQDITTEDGYGQIEDQALSGDQGVVTKVGQDSSLEITFETRGTKWIAKKHRAKLRLLSDEELRKAKRRRLDASDQPGSPASSKASPTEPLSLDEKCKGLPRRERERCIIKELTPAEMKQGQKWYIVSFKWWRAWADYTNWDDDGEETAAADPLTVQPGGWPPDSDNPYTPLLDDDEKVDDAVTDSSLPDLHPDLHRELSDSRNTTPNAICSDDLADPDDDSGLLLRKGLQENGDFVYVYEDAYKKLKEWYTSTGKEFERDIVVKKTMWATDFSVSLYPVFVFMRLFKRTDEEPGYAPDDSTQMVLRMSDKENDTIRTTLMQVEHRWKAKRAKEHPEDEKEDEKSPQGETATARAQRSSKQKSRTGQREAEQAGKTIGQRWRLTVEREVESDDGKKTIAIEVSEQMLDSWTLADLNLRTEKDILQMFADKKDPSGKWIRRDKGDQWMAKLEQFDIIDATLKYKEKDILDVQYMSTRGSKYDGEWYQGRISEVEDDGSFSGNYCADSVRFPTVTKSSGRLKDLTIETPNRLEFADMSKYGDPYWYEVQIVEVKSDKILIHYITLPNKYDEWLPVERDGQGAITSIGEGPKFCTEVAKRNTHTTELRLNGKYPYRKDPVTSPSKSTYGGWSRDADSTGTPLVKGIVGLQNLGNTCFMNSTIQCMAQAPSLTEYFVEQKYKQEINRDNPLGKGGRIASEWGELLTKAYSGKYKKLSPVSFKKTIGEFAPQFAGYQQQDSQELLSFLLDGLHEDLNRVYDKPATEAVESKGRPDSVVAAEAWQRHLKRNKSVIVDNMVGQVKSTLNCPGCKQTCIVFDPVMYLSVPLPTQTTRSFVYIFISAEPDVVPQICNVQVPKEGRVSDLEAAVAAQHSTDNAKVSAADLYVVDVWNSTVHTSGVQRSTKMLRDIRDGGTDDIHIFHMPSTVPNPAPAFKGFHVGDQVKADKLGDEEGVIVRFYKNGDMEVEVATGQNHGKQRITPTDNPRPANEAQDKPATPVEFSEGQMVRIRMTTEHSQMPKANLDDVVVGQVATVKEIKDGGRIRVELVKEDPEYGKLTRSVLPGDLQLWSEEKEAEKVESNSFSVVVFLVTRGIFVVDVGHDYSLEDVKNKVQQEYGYNAGSLRFIQKGKEVGSASTNPFDAAKPEEGKAFFRDMVVQEELVLGVLRPPERLEKGAKVRYTGDKWKEHGTTGQLDGMTKQFTSPVRGKKILYRVQLDKSGKRIFIEPRYLVGMTSGQPLLPAPIAPIKSRPVEVVMVAEEGMYTRNKTKFGMPLMICLHEHMDNSEVCERLHGMLKKYIKEYDPDNLPYTLHHVRHDNQMYGTLDDREITDDDGYFHRPLPAADPNYDRSFNYNKLTDIQIHVKFKNEFDYDSSLVGDKAKRHESAPKGKMKSGSSDVVKLADCLTAYTEPEKLTVENAWYCRECKEHQQATKKMDVYRLPNILVIHLKRFTYQQFFNSALRNKIESLVDFPLNDLDLSPWVVDLEARSKMDPSEHGYITKADCQYDCFAVSNHSGGLGGGHYTAYARSLMNGQWYDLNDSFASSADPSYVVREQAYVLYYVRKKKTPEQDQAQGQNTSSS